MFSRLRSAVAAFLSPELADKARAHDELLAEIAENDQAAYHEGFEAGAAEADGMHSEVFTAAVTWLSARAQLRDTDDVNLITAAEVLEALDSHERRLLRGVARPTPALVDSDPNVWLRAAQPA